MRARFMQTSRIANSSATSTSCQRYAIGVHADRGIWRPSRLTRWARIRTPKRLSAFNGLSFGARYEIDPLQQQYRYNRSPAVTGPDPVVNQYAACRRIAVNCAPIADQ